jgi:uncharacterized membrane protein (UPF0127 family)
VSRLTWVIAIMGVVVAAGLAAALGLWLSDGGDEAGGAGGSGADEGAAGGDDGSRAREPLEGFGEVAVTISGPGDGGGEGEGEWCLLLAETSEQRQRGLMEVTDPALGGYDGMLFRFPDDVTAAFYMRNTPMPLSIAFIDEEGQLVSTTDMEPCEDRDGCPLYPAAGPFRWAIEVPQGGLERLGLVAGATFTDTAEPCEPAPGT